MGTSDGATTPTHITYLYDHENWALHNIGKLLRPSVEADGHVLALTSEQRWHAAPGVTDVLYLSYSSLRNDVFPYRAYAREVITSVHDPVEVSNFTNTLAWPRRPLHPREMLRLEEFDRVSVISREMHELVARYYRPDVLLTPTHPHNADEILAARSPRPANAPITFFSTTNSKAYFSAGDLRYRVHQFYRYLYDQHSRLNPLQMLSAGILTRRKNLPLMHRLGRRLEHLPGARVEFRTGTGASLSDSEYLAHLTAADIYVCTSSMEGGPLPVMEAVMGGLAVLTTPVGQAADWVEDGVNGFICRTFREFADRAAFYVAHPDVLRQHQAESARRGSERRFDYAPWRRLLLGGAPPVGAAAATAASSVG